MEVLMKVKNIRGALIKKDYLDIFPKLETSLALLDRYYGINATERISHNSCNSTQLSIAHASHTTLATYASQLNSTHFI